MICNLYLSKFLKSKHIIESKIYEHGLHTIITFPEINIKGTLISTRPVSQGNRITLDINSKDWDILSNYIGNL